MLKEAPSTIDYRQFISKQSKLRRFLTYNIRSCEEFTKVFEVDE